MWSYTLVSTIARKGFVQNFKAEMEKQGKALRIPTVRAITHILLGDETYKVYTQGRYGLTRPLGTERADAIYGLEEESVNRFLEGKAVIPTHSLYNSQLRESVGEDFISNVYTNWEIVRKDEEENVSLGLRLRTNDVYFFSRKSVDDLIPRYDQHDIIKPYPEETKNLLAMTEIMGKKEPRKNHVYSCFVLEPVIIRFRVREGWTPHP